MRRWSRRCQEYKRICNIIAAKYKLTPETVTSILTRYIQQCKRSMLKGDKISFFGIIHLKLHNKQVSKIKLSYRQRRIRYAKKAHFKKHVFKSGTAHHKKNKEAAEKYLKENLYI